MNNHVVITRHAALVDYLVETGVISPGTAVITHATPDDVANKHVIGVLPLHLACLAASVIEVPLDIPPEVRGRELTLDEIRLYARPAVEYVVLTYRTQLTQLTQNRRFNFKFETI